jgi:hypothetical protein
VKALVFLRVRREGIVEDFYLGHVAAKYSLDLYIDREREREREREKERMNERERENE